MKELTPQDVFGKHWGHDWELEEEFQEDEEDYRDIEVMIYRAVETVVDGLRGHQEGHIPWSLAKDWVIYQLRYWATYPDEYKSRFSEKGGSV